MSADTAKLIAQARTITGSHGSLVLALAVALERAEAQRDERITRESGLALIEDVKRWQNAYVRVCNEKAAAEAQRDTLAAELADVRALLVSEAALAAVEPPEEQP